MSLGLGFCPEKDFDSFETIKDIHLFASKLVLKVTHNKKKSCQDWINNVDWSHYKRSKGSSTTFQILEENETSEWVDEINQIDLEELLEINDSPSSSVAFPLLNEF